MSSTRGPRGPYLTSTEARQRMLSAGAAAARDLPPTDAFAHHRAADIAEGAGMSKSGVYRNFDNLEELHTSAMVAIADEVTAEQDAMLASEVLELLGGGTDPVEMVHRLSHESFKLGLVEDSVDMSVLLATLSDTPEIARSGFESERASVTTMAELYEGIDERTGSVLREGLSYEDLAVMIFAIHDGLVIWHHSDPEAVPLDGEGPDDVSGSGQWDPFSVGVWALLDHFRPQASGRAEGS